jgi:hypothetical protein
MSLINLSIATIAGMAGIFGFTSNGAAAGCDARTPDSLRGSPDCPVYVAPATTAVPQSADGSVIVRAGTTTQLFNGVTPPNGFLINMFNPPPGPGVLPTNCFWNDNGPAIGSNGFYIGNQTFISPLGYRPLGPVSIWCNQDIYAFVRGW